VRTVFISHVVSRCMHLSVLIPTYCKYISGPQALSILSWMTHVAVDIGKDTMATPGS
jgi:hypothetical protein